MVPAAGVGFKAEHFAEALAAPAAGLWFEVHAENYMVAGGPRIAMLETLRRHRPLSIHGVGMSLAGSAEPDPEHLGALKRLVDRFEPALVSEHLAWSRLDGRCFPDLLPVPRTNEVLTRCAANIGRVQDALGRQILIENPTHYLALSDHSWSETSFLAELARRSGCGLLIDVNNVAVGAHNLGYDPASWLQAIPADHVGEVHLAGHSLDAEGTLLIDSHDEPISEHVWRLYEQFAARIGPRPTLIERDGNLPPFADLMRERDYAQNILAGELALAA
ncbi:MNIO family bufferin maturase [Sphingomonas hankyongi]|uniref:UPF0276 protein LZ538_06785 n=1 Tax=Sphingomonas hankyongi TaxID=2908209 RepID=A0ABT0S1M7_9SPHN|nr:DUF692 domain-containing protein [Sphingomonas hankyongi]MCL6729760.1 DUF692 domain-containing protein [Sphingomonas hankyongi]